MAGTGKKWAVGCGIGCGLMLIILGGVGTCGYFGVRRIVDRAEEIDESFEELDARFGKAQEFVPDPLGRIAPDRIEAFLAVRAAMDVGATEAYKLVSTIDDGVSGPGGFISKVKAGVRLIPAMLGFIEDRNRVLVAEGMGLGEYQYIFALAYFGLLDKEVADGPSFQIQGPEEESDDGFRWEFGEEAKGDEKTVRSNREAEIRKYLNRALLDMARNQLARAEELAVDSDDPELVSWRDMLAAEVEAMDREPRRILWEEGLPDPVRDSLEPYRLELDELYDGLLNVLELGMVNHQ